MANRISAAALLATLPMISHAAAPATGETLGLAEVKTVAGAHFDKLNKDSDGTLDVKELQGVIGPAGLKAADPDNDGTLTKDEYLVLVERLFKKADADNDGTLSVAELKSKAARTLRRLID